MSKCRKWILALLSLSFSFFFLTLPYPSNDWHHAWLCPNTFDLFATLASLAKSLLWEWLDSKSRSSLACCGERIRATNASRLYPPKRKLCWHDDKNFRLLLCTIASVISPLKVNTEIYLTNTILRYFFYL